MVTELHQIAEKIIDALRGTCDDLQHLLEEYSVEDNMTVLNEIDQQIFCCSVCGWWCDISEECSDEYDLPDWT